MDDKIKFRVAICGGGIGGLTCAVALSKYPDIAVDIYESAAKFSEIGAGVGIWPRPWNILKTLGLEDDLLEAMEYKPTDETVTSFHFRKGDQQPEGTDFFELITQGRLLFIHRADFQKVLLAHLPASVQTLFSKRLQSYSQSSSGPIHLVFEDGLSATCDVLIGADGIKSSVRRSFLLDETKKLQCQGKSFLGTLSAIDPVWTGTVAYRNLIPVEKLNVRWPNHRVLTQPMHYVGKDLLVVAYTVSKGTMINVAAYRMDRDLEHTTFEGSWVSSLAEEDVKALYAHWEPEVRAIIDCFENPRQWAVHVIKPLASFVSSRVALIGDAAHAMAPFQGSGAGQAIEDAYILAAVLGHPHTNLNSIADALDVFDAIRRPSAMRVAELSRLNGQYFSLNYEGLDFGNLRGESLMLALQTLSETVNKNWAWAWTTTVDSASEAVSLMLVEI